MLTELERTLAEHACARLATSYGIYSDSRNIDAFTTLWAEDGVWHNSRGAQRGPETIRQDLEKQPKISLGRHVCTNMLVTVHDAEHATGISYFTFYNAPDPGPARPVTIALPQFVGQYFDEYVKTPAGWKFASRRMEVVFKFA